ncbi:coiled-coil domain-containing protein 166 [Hoplias malabaricus]|uniref:coiled-coil domain-containing protein 166 n=1 Tax=Hoplias malabaricus TaxID=27720 RepID=UPI00346384B4
MSVRGTDPEQSTGEDVHTEYEELTETLRALKRRSAQLRKDNEFLQNEVYKTRMESEEYESYMSKQTEKRESMIVALNEQRQMELEELRRQREETLKKYEEQAKELKRVILEKEKELALLNSDIDEVREVKSLQQQQLGHIAELKQQIVDISCRHSEALQALKFEFLREKAQYEAQAKHKVQMLTIEVNKEASRCLLSHVKEVSEENQRLREELQQVIQRAHVLQNQQKLLQSQHRKLLLEREYMHELHLLRFSTHSDSTTQGGASS